MIELNFLNNVRISRRVMLALSIPVIALIAFAIALLLEKRQIATDMADVESLSVLAPVMSEFIHEMQKERGVSAGFIGSKGIKFGDALKKQRLETDTKRAALNEALDTFDASAQLRTFTDYIVKARRTLGDLNEVRSSISDLKLNVSEMANYYTSTIAAFLSTIEQMAVLSTNAEITKIITAYTNFLEGKESAGLERAMGSAGFSAGKFSPAVYRRFVGLIAGQDNYFKRFALYATDGQKALFTAKLAAPAVEEVNKMREIALESPFTGNTGGIDGAVWFDAITAKINLLKEVEDFIALSLKIRASELGSAAQHSFAIILSIVLAVLVIGGTFSFVAVRGIVRPIKGMTAAMKNLAAGDTSGEIPAIGQRDEIGEMASTLQVFRDNAIERVRLEDERRSEHAARFARQNKIEELIGDFHQKAERLLGAVRTNAAQMQVTAGSLSTTATQNNAKALSIAAASEQASQNVRAVATASEELSGSIKEIARQINQTREVVGKATVAIQEFERWRCEP